MINKKAQRWGVKVCVIAKSQTRYTHQVEIYKGISNTARYPNGCFFYKQTTFHKYESDNLQKIYSSYGKRFQVIPVNAALK